ncbi:hypothetical protein ACIBEK_06170 [Nocardia fusca]|uniref:hypothetical protein n=1 Tax=Nocardia fusca TaxID=941183 RepID=UPI0037A45DC8
MPHIQLAQARILLTGASGGIGHAGARELVGHGAQLVLTGRRAGTLGAHVMVSPPRIMTSNQTYLGWFTTAEGQEMADLAASGTVDLDVLVHEIYGLEDTHTAKASLAAGERDGGFSNFVISPATNRSQRGEVH